jgi:cyanophycinase
MRQLVDDADAFFINGGDQSLTLRSLQLSPGRFTPLAQRMLDRIESGIPLGGSSAGTAVQSGNKSSRVPMISGGDSEHALRHGAMAVEANTQLCQMHGNCAMHSDPDQLTYRAGGGLRTMSLGVVDTHFHEREREGRLLRLLLDTGTRFGFGVDEATVLKVDFRAGDDADLQVMGRGGVWLVDTGSATANRGDRQWMASGFRVARLLAGDTAQLRSGELSVDLRCLPDAQLKPGQIVDDTAYAKTKGRHWSRLADSNGVIACKRADGRWRYDRMRIQLIQDL